MPKGKVLWYDEEDHGHGMIAPEDGGEPLPVDILGILIPWDPWNKTLATGQRVRYVQTRDRKGQPCAVNVTPIHPAWRNVVSALLLLAIGACLVGLLLVRTRGPEWAGWVLVATSVVAVVAHRLVTRKDPRLPGGY